MTAISATITVPARAGSRIFSRLTGALRPAAFCAGAICLTDGEDMAGFVATAV
jgi:hypothetical protein